MVRLVEDVGGGRVQSVGDLWCNIVIRGVRWWSHIIGGKVSSGPLTYYGSLSSLLTHTLPYPQTVNAPRAMKNNSYLQIP